MKFGQDAIRQAVVYAELLKSLPKAIHKDLILICAKELIDNVDTLRSYPERAKVLIN